MQDKGNRDRTLHDALRRLWELGWGLVLVIMLTLVSQLFPRLRDPKPQPEMRPVAATSVLHSVK